LFKILALLLFIPSLAWADTFVLAWNLNKEKSEVIQVDNPTVCKELGINLHKAEATILGVYSSPTFYCINTTTGKVLSAVQCKAESCKGQDYE